MRVYGAPCYLLVGGRERLAGARWGGRGWLDGCTVYSKSVFSRGEGLAGVGGRIKNGTPAEASLFPPSGGRQNNASLFAVFGKNRNKYQKKKKINNKKSQVKLTEKQKNPKKIRAASRRIM